MRIAYLSPGAGNRYCGNCLRDNALAAELRRQGHNVCAVPLYLPPLLDEPDGTQNIPVFFGGINVYLEQKIPLFRYVPKALRTLLDSRVLLKLAGSGAASTQPAEVGDMTVSMLQGQDGKQCRELEELCRFLKTEVKPDVVCFSNALLLGMQAAVKDATGAKIICFLSGEDSFLNELTEPFREQSWKLVSKHCGEVDTLTAPSKFYASFMSQCLGLPQERIQILPPGINTTGYGETPLSGGGIKCLGFLARTTYSKGLDTLVDAFIEVRKRGNFVIQLKIGGSNSSTKIIRQQSIKFENETLKTAAEWFLNLSRTEKIKFLESLTLFSVPSRLNEPFGLFVLEAFAAGVPSLYPNRGAFPEIAEQSGACVLFEPENPVSLADAVEELLGDESRCCEMSANAKRAVAEHWNITKTAERLAEFF